MASAKSLIDKATEILKVKTAWLDEVQLRNFVQSYSNRRTEFLEAVQKHGSPLYTIDRLRLVERARLFRAVFEDKLLKFKVFYAVKSNNHPLIAGTLVNEGFGLDVSSGLELELALKQKANEIIFSGPAKTEKELELALNEAKRVTVLMDSFGELERLERIAARHRKIIKCGVRLTTEEKGVWRKFGIPLSTLAQFFEQASECKHIDLRGLQFHTSWNLTPNKQINFIKRLANALKDLAPRFRNLIEFVDIGGGFWPEQGEWLQRAGTTEGKLEQAVEPSIYGPMEHYWIPAMPLEQFATELAKTIKEELFPYIEPIIFAEPGRWLCHESMHILLTVADKKAEDLVITDGGTNIIGWERFETDYFPLINLSQPATDEHECLVLGSLCTPHDVWGYGYFGAGIQTGDVLLIPTQGAYTYSLRQHFIKPLPDAVFLDNHDS